jgi:hypothetical protein
MPSLKQTGFAGGVISPQLRGRTDQTKYASGLKTCDNFIVTRFGSVENRAGTVYDGEVKDSTQQIREVAFIFNATVSYMLEFGDSYIRPWKLGARISVAGAAAWDAGTTYTQGALVTYNSLVYWSKIDGNIANAPDVSPTDWYLQAAGLLEIPTYIPQAALADMQYVQQNDIMTLVNQLFYPAVLKRFSDTVWQFGQFVASTGISPPTGVNLIIGVGPSPTPAAPTGLAAVGGQAASAKLYYVVTAWLTAPFNTEGAPSAAAQSTVGSPTPGFPVVLTWNAVAAISGYAVYKGTNIAGDPKYLIAVIETGTLTFTDDGIAQGTPLRTAQEGAVGAILFDYVVTAVDASTGAESLASTSATGYGNTPTDANPNVISWNAVTNASKYNIYRLVAGIYSFVGSTPLLTFSDPNILPDSNIQPPVPLPLFATANDYPGVVGYYQQRLGFANTINQPQTVSLSRVAVSTAFTVSTPVQDNDAVQFTIAGKQVQEVRALVDNGKLIIHTSGGEYVANGNQAGQITPTGISLVQQGSAGSEFISPVTIGSTDLFVQARGTIIRDLRYSIQTTSYSGQDLTIFAPSLFANRTIADMDWQQIHNSILWVVLDNGTLLGLTYIHSQEIWGWHRHTTGDGDRIENVVVIPEGDQDVTYVCVKRTINGVTKRYIEHFAKREFSDITTDAIFVDSALTYDGRNTSGTTMTLTTGGGWTPTDNLTLTSSVGYFVAGDVGNMIVLQQIVDGVVIDSVRLNIIGYTSPTVVTVQPGKDVPAWAQVALTTWGKGVHQFSGIDHLEGRTIGGLGDGNVIPQTVVSGGAFTTALNYVVLTVGLPIQADLETLPLENTQGETISNKKVVVIELTAILYDTRGGFYGQDFAHLQPLVQRAGEPWSDPTFLFTGPRRIPVQGSWQTTGQLAIRQTDPLPMGISALVNSVQVGN